MPARGRKLCTCSSLLAVFLLSLSGARAAESDALAIDANIRARHMPFGTILDPVFASASSDQIVGYTRCGDSALWTGAYLAAEAYRYKVTQSADALQNVKAALAGLTALTDVTGDNRLARCMVLADSPYAAGIQSEEASNTIHQSPPWIWVDNTSRDQMVGAFFGLGAAFDLVDDATVKSGISDLATRLIGYVSRHNWSPNDDPDSTFQVRPEELQMLLQVARHANPANGVSGPFFVAPVDVAVDVDVQSNDSYFKFNLDYMTFYNLVRIQDNGDNRGAYGTLRSHTASHQNAFFDMIDRVLNGANATRDAEAASLLDQWLQRPRRDMIVDLSRTVPVCGNEACQPIPVLQRPPADFLWQVSPFQLSGGLIGTIEGAGIDYILPYWMGRYYGVISGGGPTEGTIQSAAAPMAAFAPGSLVTIKGTNLANGDPQSGGEPPPLTLGGDTVTITDAAGNSLSAPLLYVSPNQINLQIPDSAATGNATFTVNGAAGTQTFTANIQTVAPTLFSMNATGSGVAAATAVMVQVANPNLQSPVPVFQCDATGCVAVPIRLGIDTPIVLTLYGTGIRNRSSQSNVTVTIKGISVPVQYAGVSPGYAGLDQVNVLMELSLIGGGESNVVLTVDGQTSNTVTINVQ